jgi:hypothetical protein
VYIKYSMSTSGVSDALRPVHSAFRITNLNCHTTATSTQDHMLKRRRTKTGLDIIDGEKPWTRVYCGEGTDHARGDVVGFTTAFRSRKLTHRKVNDTCKCLITRDVGRKC